MLRAKQGEDMLTRILFFLLAFSVWTTYGYTASNSCSSESFGFKRYLETKDIFPKHNGFLVDVEDEFFFVHELQIDDHGIFIEKEKMSAPWSHCPCCGMPLVYGFCINPECPSKG